MENNNSKLKLQNFLPYRLSVLSNRISRAIADDYERQFSLSLLEWRVIAVLAEGDGLSAAKITEKTAMDKVAVSRTVKKLLVKTRIKREFSKSDKRRSIITLTKNGWDIYNKVVPLAIRYEATLLKELSLTEIKQLDHLIVKLDDIQLHLHDLEN